MDSNSMSDWQDFFTFVGLVAGGLTAWALLVAALPVQTLARYPWPDRSDLLSRLSFPLTESHGPTGITSRRRAPH